MFIKRLKYSISEVKEIPVLKIVSLLIQGREVINVGSSWLAENTFPVLSSLFNLSLLHCQCYMRSNKGDTMQNQWRGNLCTPNTSCRLIKPYSLLRLLLHCAHACVCVWRHLQIQTFLGKGESLNKCKYCLKQSEGTVLQWLYKICAFIFGHWQSTMMGQSASLPEKLAISLFLRLGN